MNTEILSRFKYLVDTLPGILLNIDEKEFSKKPAPEKWSKKEIVGHLVDSAANNHQRFIRTQYENVPFIVYDQNKWNSLNHYNDLPGKHVIELWHIYNRHLVEIVSRIPADQLTKECNSGDDTNHTLAWLIGDYVVHMEHHLKQITDY